VRARESRWPASAASLFVIDLMNAGLSKDQIMTVRREVDRQTLWAELPADALVGCADSAKIPKT
jgi:hypothetical protein